MELQFFLIGLFVLLAGGAMFFVFGLRKRIGLERRRAKSVLSSVRLSAEELEAEAEIREIKSRRYKFYRISGFKWILSVVFAVILLFLATFEYWVVFYPTPQIGKTYPITVKAAYPFTHLKILYPRGTPVLRRGEVITPREIQRLDEYRQQRQFPSLAKLEGYFLLFIIFILFLVFWLTIFFQEARQDENRNLVFIFSAILLVLILAKTLLLTDFISVYYVPLSMLAMLVTILVFSRIVPSVVIFAALFVTMISEFNIHFLLVLFGGGMVTVFLLQKVKKRTQVISAGMAVGICNLGIYLAVLLAEDTYRLSSLSDVFHLIAQVRSDAFACLANGAVSAFLTLLLIPFFEKAFGYLSPFKLMELSDLDSEILRELYLKAPGTYHHSLAVANLAEIAANEIGANSVLLRVGAYYHDIGKMFKPKFFVENMGGREENPHELISPYASSKILKSHVALGIELGEKYGLPRKIIDLIPQHHGTSLMDYFFEKAKNKTDAGTLSEKYFSYPGPRPQTKEAAILMIVDSVEAAFRVLTDHAEETVRRMIEKVTFRKMEQGQLDEAPLTILEVRQITNALTKALATSAYKRVDYPSSTGIDAQFSSHSDTFPGTVLIDLPPEALPPSPSPATRSNGKSHSNGTHHDKPKTSH